MARPRKPLPDHITAELRDLIEALRHHTDASGMSLIELSGRANLSTATISRALGGTQTLTLQVLTALMDGLGLQQKQRHSLIGRWRKAEQAARDRRDGLRRIQGQNAVDARETLHNLHTALGSPTLRSLETSTGMARSTLQRALAGDAPTDTMQEAIQRLEALRDALRAHLSPIQIRILEYLADGMTTEGIATLCNLPTAVVRRHRARIHMTLSDFDPSRMYESSERKLPAGPLSPVTPYAHRAEPPPVTAPTRHLWHRLQETTNQVTEVVRQRADDEQSINSLLTALNEATQLALELRKKSDTALWVQDTITNGTGQNSDIGEREEVKVSHPGPVPIPVASRYPAIETLGPVAEQTSRRTADAPTSNEEKR